MRANIRNSRQSGNPLPPDYIKDYEHFEHTYIRNRGFLADKHVIFEAKQYVDTLVEKYDYIPFEYDFVSEIVGPEESKAQTIFEREKIHLTYLLSCMNGDDKEHRSAQTYIKAADKARTKSKVFLALFLLCLIGGFAALVGGSMLNAQIVSGGGPEENVGVYITGIGFVAMIVSIVFFIMMIVNKKKSRR